MHRLPRELLEIVASFLPPRGLAALARASTQTWRLLDRDEPWVMAWCALEAARHVGLAPEPTMRPLRLVRAVVYGRESALPIAEYRRGARLLMRHLPPRTFINMCAHTPLEFAAALDELRPDDPWCRLFAYGAAARACVTAYAAHWCVTSLRTEQLGAAQDVRDHVARLLGW